VQETLIGEIQNVTHSGRHVVEHDFGAGLTNDGLFMLLNERLNKYTQIILNPNRIGCDKHHGNSFSFTHIVRDI
jgi:hypothetical protein